MRKPVAFDDDTFDKLRRPGRCRTATIQQLADGAFGDVLKKHGISLDLEDVLHKSAALSKAAAQQPKSRAPRQSQTARQAKS